MPELTGSQLIMIRKQVSDGVPLEELLLSQFPDATIAIIRGFDNLSEEPYNKGAYFDERRAVEAMAEIPPNGTLPDTYHIVTCTVSDLSCRRILDMRTEDPLDEVDVSMAYASLRERLFE